MSEVRTKIIALKNFMDEQIIGQDDLVNKLIITLLADGNALVEGAPGLAKTKAIKTLASAIKTQYNRIQFTPDLLPSDITGSDIYVAEKGTFEFCKGPIFANLILADEINRAPAKVQSALLEAMAERQVSVGGNTYDLPKLFMVMATQNPIEHEGTYNLPEAQLDRFLMYIKIDQPDAESEKKILKLIRREISEQKIGVPAMLDVNDVLLARQEAMKVHMSDAVEEYMVQLIMATRHLKEYDARMSGYIMYGASPRATLALDRCAKIHAWLQERDYVTPEDIRAVIFDILRHRIILSFEAQAEGVTTDDVIAQILKLVPLP
ncbi:MAG: MoxR family ATPase [Alphaproteobacteria bacterium]|nr:MoxR family ATPase [Alphaproteobacteria bacterium]